MAGPIEEVVVLARGSLSDDSGVLAVRVGLAIPLGGARVVLLLVDTAAALGVEGVTPGGRGGQLSREIAALIEDEESPVMVEEESLWTLGLSDRTLRPGVKRIDRSVVEEWCRKARCCIVL
ncbi:MAG TPA: hypothetical protein VNF75_07980 [Candidatus Dormibacteraeota bacterium]|nr:hypothetical protein [Candidatus Dormibacteraeota bacterium]